MNFSALGHCPGVYPNFFKSTPAGAIGSPSHSPRLNPMFWAFFNASLRSTPLTITRKRFSG